MFKAVILIGLLCLSMQHDDKLICEDLADDECINSVSCKWRNMGPSTCDTITYYALEAPLDVISQYAVASLLPCVSAVPGPGQFIITESFTNSQPFQYICHAQNIINIVIGGQSKGPAAGRLDLVTPRTEAIIQPEVEPMCALLFEKTNFRGKRWLICDSTKLNGKRIRSIMPGTIFSEISLFTRQGDPLVNYQRKFWYDVSVLDKGLPDIKEDFEYIKVVNNHPL